MSARSGCATSSRKEGGASATVGNRARAVRAAEQSALETACKVVELEACRSDGRRVPVEETMLSESSVHRKIGLEYEVGKPRWSRTRD